MDWQGAEAPQLRQMDETIADLQRQVAQLRSERDGYRDMAILAIVTLDTLRGRMEELDDLHRDTSMRGGER